MPVLETIDRYRVTTYSVPITAADIELEAAFEARCIDPFGVDNSCISPGGHAPIAVGGEIVCHHCAKVFWR